jgi:HPt (histidine-containing phosphotransfer) domain-containing protein
VGINDFQSKPINPEELFLTLARWLPPLKNPIAVDDSPQQSDQHSIYKNDHHLDLTQLLDAVAQDQDRAKFLIEKFLVVAASIHINLEQALKVGDCVSMQHLAHKLKSSASLLGANDLAANCEELEAAAHAVNAEVSKAACQKLMASLTIVRDYLSRRFNLSS